MASRTRVPTRTIEDVLAGTIDVIDRADRLLGKVDLIRYRGILCEPANPIDTQTIVGGVPVDPRVRTWVLNQLTDSVQTAPILGAVWDVSDRWARQLGQVDLARVLGAALTVANPVISGVYDAAGNRMPSMDAVARPGYVDVIDRAARLLGVVYGSQAQQLLQRAGTFDLFVQIRNAGVEISPATEATLGSINTKLVSGTDIGDVTINNAAAGSAVNIQDGGNTITVDGTLTQSTKHDSKVYAPAIFDAAASGNLVAAVANKVTKLHALAIQAQGTVVVNLNDGAGGASLMEWSFQAREGAVLNMADAPAYWAITSVNTILYVTLSAAVQVTITAIVSSDDAS